MPFSFAAFSHLNRQPRRATRWVRGLAAVSLGNLCYLRLWDSILQSPERNYLAETPLGPTDYIAAVIGLMVFAAAAYVAIGLMWYSQKRWIRAVGMGVVLLLLGLPLDFVRRSAGWDLGGHIALGRYVVIAGGAALLVGLAVFLRQRFFSALLWGLAILSPYAAINIGTAAFEAVKTRGQPRVQTAVRLPHVPTPPARHRVIWIIFDELDQSALFSHRPPDLRLPNLDAFIARSVVATNAFPPSGRTIISLPALLSGAKLDDAKGTDLAQLRVRRDGVQSWDDFRSLDNIVSHVASLGRRVTVFGWYHPYGRLFPTTDLITSHGWGFPAYQGYRAPTLAKSVFRQIQYLVSPFFGRDVSGAFYTTINTAAMQAVADPAQDLIFLHYDIPHLPGIYSRQEHRLSSAISSDVDGYWSNVALVDDTLGQLQQAIDAAGLRTNTTVIITSDHWWRTSPWLRSQPNYRVPLLINVDGATNQIIARNTFCTVETRRLVEGVLAGAVRTNGQVADWIGELHGAIPVSYAGGAPQWPKPESANH